MKNVLLLLSFFSSALVLQSQTVTSQWLSNISNQTRSLANPLAVQLGNTGAGITWNLSSLVADSSSVAQYSGTAGLPGATNYPDASLAEFTTYFGLPRYTYYETTASSLEDQGFFILSGNDSLHDVASDGRLFLQFPLSLGTTYTDSYSFANYVAGSLASNTNGNIEILADASGTLILPGGVSINDVLRVKFTEQYTVSPTIPLPPPPPAGQRTTYIWISPSHPGLILASWSSDVFNNQEAVNTFFYSVPSSISIESAVTQVKTTPVVYDDQFYVPVATKAGAAKLVVFNTAGQKVMDLEGLKPAEQPISLSNLNDGLYIYRLQFESGETFAGKFNLTR